MVLGSISVSERLVVVSTIFLTLKGGVFASFVLSLILILWIRLLKLYLRLILRTRQHWWISATLVPWLRCHTHSLLAHVLLQGWGSQLGSARLCPICWLRGLLQCMLMLVCVHIDLILDGL